MRLNKVAVFHPSSELYGADRILVEVLKALPKDCEKHVYLRFKGSLKEYIMDNVKNVKVINSSHTPVIYRDIFNLTGIMRFIYDYIQFTWFLKKQVKKEP